MPLGRARAPFPYPDRIFEVKWDGFRALLLSDSEEVRLLAKRERVQVTSRPLPRIDSRSQGAVDVFSMVKIVCLDSRGKPQFRELLFRRGQPRFVAFDILWG